VAAFHRHLPLEKLAKGEKVQWNLATPSSTALLYETGGGLYGLVAKPVQGGISKGIKEFEGIFFCVAGLVAEPPQGGIISGTRKKFKKKLRVAPWPSHS
jgi:hypothetical protein